MAAVRGLEIPTGIPLVYRLDKDLKPLYDERASGLLSGYFLGDPEEIKKVRGCATTPRADAAGPRPSAPRSLQAQEKVANQSKLRCVLRVPCNECQPSARESLTPRVPLDRYGVEDKTEIAKT